MEDRVEALLLLPDEPDMFEGNTTKMPKNFEGFYSFNVLDVFRESIILLRFNSKFFLWIAFVFILPFSSVLLGQLWITAPFIGSLASKLELIATSQGFWFTPSFRIFYVKVPENIVANIFQLPFFVLFGLTAKLMVSSGVAMAYTGRRLVFVRFLSNVPKLWKRLATTYFWICVILLQFLISIALFIGLVVFTFKTFQFSSDMFFLAFVIVAIIFSVAFAHLMIVCNLSLVISVLEDCYGVEALSRAYALVKGRTQVALLLFVLNNLSMASVDSLFQYRVIGVPGYGYKIDAASKMWEAPLLIGMYTFLSLVDCMSSSVFYFTCKSRSKENQDTTISLVDTSV